MYVVLLFRLEKCTNRNAIEDTLLSILLSRATGTLRSRKTFY